MREWIQILFKGAILKKADANQLIRSLLSSLSLHIPDADKSAEPEEFAEDESLSQALKQALKTKNEKEKVTEPSPGQSGLNKNLQPIHKKEDKVIPGNKQDPKSKNTLCKLK